jgi:hypothetical protein
MPPNHPAIAPPTQPVAQVDALNTADAPLKEQRAWSFESSYLDMVDLEEHLDGCPNLTYHLEVNNFLFTGLFLRGLPYPTALPILQCVIENYAKYLQQGADRIILFANRDLTEVRPLARWN